MISKKAFLLFLPLILSGCSSSVQIQSSYNDKIVVDGKYEEWGTALRSVDDKNIAAGFANDKNFLYLCLVTSDRNAVRKILMNGLTVWIGSSRGKIGIKYPFRPDPSELREMRMNRPPERSDDQPAIRNILKRQEDLQVINEKELPLYTGNASAGRDFRGMIDVDNNVMVYEMRIPVRNNDISDRIFAVSTDKLEIKYKTGEINREEGMRGTPPGQRTPGERGGMGGNRRGGMRPQMEGADLSPLEFTFDVIIAR